jgi:hypothetical protein
MYYLLIYVGIDVELSLTAITDNVGAMIMAKNVLTNVRTRHVAIGTTLYKLPTECIIIIGISRKKEFTSTGLSMTHLRKGFEWHG